MPKLTTDLATLPIDLPMAAACSPSPIGGIGVGGIRSMTITMTPPLAPAPGWAAHTHW